MAVENDRIDETISGVGPNENTEAAETNEKNFDESADETLENEKFSGDPENPAPATEDLLQAALYERDEYLNMAQRIQAEFENYKRRNQSVRAEAWEDGARETISLMLPVIDNLERALEASKEKTPLRDGVELIHRQMLELLEKRCVSVIDRVGEPFDPELENAVMQADPSEGAPGSVCTVLQKGYKTASRVIRYAMVRVVPSD